MKKLLFCAMVISAMSACSDDLGEIERRVDGIEKKQEEMSAVEPRLRTMSFSADANPMQLVESVDCEIIGDSIVECWVRNVMDSKRLIADFEFDGDSVWIDSLTATSGMTAADYDGAVRITVMAGDKSRVYTVYVHAFTGLPVMWIETEGRKEIASKNEYLKANMRLTGDAGEQDSGGTVRTSTGIKGRGNTTWGAPKKPYRLKLDEKLPLLGMPKDKSWVMLANYYDKTMLRIQTAFGMGRISNLEYTPRARFVELMLNGRYNGTYLLCEKLKTGTHRVNAGDGGFLLEVDAKADSSDVTFMVPHLVQPVSIKDPDGIAEGDGDYIYVRDFVTAADEALYGDSFADPQEGWQKYMDMDSFVDWYLINEIARNTDASMFTSCYMSLERGGKLKMGPLWDFDAALGNVNYNSNYRYDGFWLKVSPWFSRMFHDPAFVAKVKERFGYFYSRKDDIMREINTNAHHLRYAVVENEAKWHTLYNYTWPNYDIWGNYQNEVQSMKLWLNSRFEWLKTAYDAL